MTFQHKEDARACIQALDNFGLDGRYTIRCVRGRKRKVRRTDHGPCLTCSHRSINANRASFGTTKYCNTFLRYVPCTTPDCLFLHDVHEDEGWTKEEIQVRR